MSGGLLVVIVMEPEVPVVRLAEAAFRAAVDAWAPWKAAKEAQPD